ncbi:MAG TPA: secretin N-terminal domain-containing protein [Pyrinomonadaceae bacterium]|nr:secretin N-terminal domain-containing protein [Pyrinomonadaceae bacterium]
MKVFKHLPVTLALLLSIASVSFAQQPTASASPTQPDTITERNFKNKVFQVKYRDPNNLANALHALGSGFTGSMITHNAEFRTITVRDFPENLAIMEEAIKRLDTPAAPRPNIELRLHVLIASNAGPGTPDMPAELKEVLTQLRGTLNYRNYELVSSIVQRLTETREILQGSGIAEVPAINAGTANIATPYEYYLRNVSLVANPAGAPTVQINEFTFKTHTATEQSRIQTALNLKDGEKVVVGTATLRNRALVLVLTANVLK